VQLKLKEFGYYTGDINGIVDDGLRNALEQFHLDQKNCPSDIGEITCRLLNEAERKLK